MGDQHRLHEWNAMLVRRLPEGKRKLFDGPPAPGHLPYKTGRKPSNWRIKPVVGFGDRMRDAVSAEAL